MIALLAAVLLAPPAAAAELVAARACVKWSKEIPGARAAGAGLFSSVARVEGAGPHASCDVVSETESFGVGWLMRAWMKQGVYSPCGRRLGGYKIRYKGDEWQAKLVAGLHDYVSRNPEALAAARDCPSAPAPAPAAAVGISTAPPAPSLPAEPVILSTGTP